MDLIVRPTINVLDMFHGDNRENIPDFVALKAAGIMAVWHKVSQGLAYIDPKFAQRRAAADAAGMPFGGYHFLNSQDADGQADFFMKNADIAGVGSGTSPLALACDYEDGGGAALHQAQSFMVNVDRSSPPGTQCVLYSGNRIRETLPRPIPGGHVADDMKGAVQFFAMHRLWLAEYGPHMNIPFPWNLPISDTVKAPGVWLWQFTENARVNPIVGNVDGNFYNGTAEQLAAHWLA